MGHYRRLQNPSSFRKLAAAMWRPPNDPHIFGFVDIEMTAPLALLERYNSEHGCRVTITHMVARALAIALRDHPEVNAKVTFSSILLRNRVDIFCQVATDDGRDLSGFLIKGADELSLAELAETLSRSAARIRKDEDPAFKRSRDLFKTLPLWALRALLPGISLLSNSLDLHMPGLGMPRDPFGSAMVTSVGMLGIDSGFAPFTPIARCPIVLTVTKIKRRPWVVEETIEPRPVLRLCGTFDHRVIDGYHAGKLCEEMEGLFSSPERLLTAAERGVGAG